MNKNDEYDIFSQKHLNVSNHGTTVKLVISDVLKVFGDIKEIISFIGKNFVNPGISIEFYDDNSCNSTPIKLNDFNNEYREYLDDVFLQCDLGTAKLDVSACKNFLPEEDFVFENGRYINSKEFSTIGHLKTLIYNDNCINSIIVKGLSDEQEQILDDNSGRCSESELISDRFSEYFDDLDQYEQCVEIYANNEDFSDVIDDDSSVIDERDGDFWIPDENGEISFLDFVLEELYPCKRFLIEKKVHNIIVNDDDFSFFRKNVKCNASGYFYRDEGFQMDFYVKNVRVDNARISIPFCFSNIALKNLKINVLNNCIPDLSRSKIPEEVAQHIGYAVGRAVHFALLKKGEISGKKLSENELRLLEKFVSKYYTEKNLFCK